ncbi:MAG: undecaprenyl-diphosphate phosphatase [bacterium]|nr:undecaprenyl-diphosphate phosphatase [bacterium]
MEPLEAAWLGIVQGLTEFFPVSSSGHLVIAEALLGHIEEGVLFEIAVHVGTLVAILAFYRERITALINGLVARKPEAWSYAGKLVLATLPAVVAGLTAKPFIESLFGEPRVVVLTLLITGSVLLTIRRTQPRAHASLPNWSQAFWIGCAQMLAIAPGISRSGSTLAVALALGVAPLAATEFSFLMAVAAITGAAVLAIPEASAADSAMLIACGIGAVTAAVSGLFALRAFVRLLERQRFHLFAYYCFAAALAFAAFLLLG